MAVTLVFGTGKNYILLFVREHNYTSTETFIIYWGSCVLLSTLYLAINKIMLRKISY